MTTVCQGKKDEAEEEEEEAEGGDEKSETLSSEDETHTSGAGILEFSPEKAGQDITPANYEFAAGKEKRSSGTLSTIAGMLNYFEFL